MNFTYTEHLPTVIISFLIFALFVYYLEKRCFTWVNRYWFMRAKTRTKLSILLYLISFAMFFFALLDLRGAESKIKADIPDVKTIILIDGSMSMLAEDVEPNRFQKAIILARHFVKNAIGHQISIVLFSETQRTVVPFTDDIDLLDSRLAGLGNLSLNNNGSNILQALNESVQYFKMENIGNENLIGNILLFSDGEDHANFGFSNLKIPDGISLVAVGVGTASGSTIPMRSPDGYLLGNKKFNREDVITKLDDQFFKKLGDVITSYKFWIILSGALPTEEIVSFFKNQFTNKTSQGDIRIRPVQAEYLIIPAILLFCLSVIFRRGQIFKMVSILLFICFQSDAGDLTEQKLSPLATQLLERVSKGLASKSERLKLAELLMRENQTNEAITLYSENRPDSFIDDPNVLLNYGTALLKGKNIDQGVTVLQSLYQHIKNNKDEKHYQLLPIIENNLSFAFLTQKQQKSDSKSGENENQGQENEKQKNKESDNGKGKQNQNNSQGNSQDNQNQNNKSPPKQPRPPEGEKMKSIEEREADIKRHRQLTKIPAILKQILSDDSELQKKQLDTKQTQHPNNQPKKDW